MILELFLFGTLWFWLLSAAWVGIMIWTVDEESGSGATVAAIVYVAALILFGNLQPLEWISTYRFEIVIGTLSYFVIGTVWSFIKWYFYLLNMRDRYNEAKQNFLNKKGIGTLLDLSDQEYQGFIEFVNSYSVHSIGLTANDKGRLIPPQALQSKATILMWMSYWPFSAFWTLLNDPIRRAFEYIYARLGGLYQRISDSVFTDMKGDMR